MSDLIETTPRMELVSQDLEHLVEALRDDHALDRALLPRRAPREAAPTALQGLLAEGPRKSMAPLVRAVEGGPPHAVRAMQAVSRAGTGDDEALLRLPWQAVEQDLGEADGVLMVTGSDLPKQGVHAAGVTGPYGGEGGKRAPCQAGVCGGAVRTPGAPLRARRLSRPAEWRTANASAERRRPRGRPPARTFTPQPALAEARCTAIVPSRSRRCRWGGRTRRVGTSRAFWRGWRGWAWGPVPTGRTPHGAGESVRPPTCRCGVGAAAARSGSVWWRTPQRRARWERSQPHGPLRRGHASRARQAARGPGWQRVPPCGWSPCARPCPVLTAAGCGGGTAQRAR